MKDIAQPYALIAAQRKLTFITSFDEDALPASVDPKCFQRIINNLFANALKFTPASSTIRITTQRLADTAQIVVEDDGAGISADSIPVLFDKFTTATRCGLRGESSYGMGLFLVHRFVTLHRGTIEVDSTVGQGTQFTIRLPLAK